MADKRLLTVTGSSGQLADWLATAEKAGMSRHRWAIATLDGAAGGAIDPAITCSGPGVRRPTPRGGGNGSMSLRVTECQLGRWKRAAAQCQFPANRWYVEILDHASGRMTPLTRQLGRIAS